jgi:ubiquinone/menaquinone biosynthesis C-methylase UbiE
MTYTHGHHESVLRSHRWRTVENSAAYAASRFVPGAQVLDVGCGPGTITIDIARRVAPGSVVGIDASADVIIQARTAATGIGNVEFAPGDVYALDYADASFDVVHAHQVLQHLADPVGALREMRRVCKPDGVVACRDGDYAAFTWYPLDPALDAWLALYRDIARANAGEPDAGRFLLAWAHAAEFPEVTPSASTWCFATPDDRAWWGALWADRMTTSAIGEQAERDGFAPRADLEEMAAAWRRWSAHPDAWFAVLHGEILCRP